MVITERKTSYKKKKKKKESDTRRQVATVNTGDLSKGQKLTQCWLVLLDNCNVKIWSQILCRGKQAMKKIAVI